MNDRFKFRAWDKETKTMHEVESLYPYKDEATQGGELFFKDFKTSYYFPEEVELMQSTGLKDKNGKLIYEGDVVKQNNTIYSVNWLNGTFCFKDTLNGENYTVEFVVPEKQEVIGNMYENKELLNE